MGRDLPYDIAVRVLKQIVLWASLTLSAAAPGGAYADTNAKPVVLIETRLGRITVEIDLAAAPITACNFLRYVKDGSYDDGSFYRTVRREEASGNPVPIDVVQADGPSALSDGDRPAIPLERTRDTGLSHVVGAISMARDGPDTATTSFFFVVQDSPELNFGGRRNPDGQGFAVFGRAVTGLRVIRAIYKMPTIHEALVTPVKILRARVIRGRQSCAGRE